MDVLNLTRYYFYDIWNEYGDPRVTKYPLMDGGPFFTIVLVCIYLYIVKSAGIKFMKDRKPFDLRTLILIFNVLLVCLNCYGFYNGFRLTNYGLDSWKCIKVNKQSQNPDDLKIIFLGWFYLITKFIDFGDTFFFVLRKKDTHLSFLHVYHHACMPIYRYVYIIREAILIMNLKLFFLPTTVPNSWMFLKFVPGGNSAFIPLINSFVHIVMYTYYALSTFHNLRPYLWWKRYLTQLQLFQFIFIIVHSIYSATMPLCGWPKLFVYLSIANAVLFFYLFFKFFMKTYKSPIPPKSKKAVQNVELQKLDDKVIN